MFRGGRVSKVTRFVRNATRCGDQRDHSPFFMNDELKEELFEIFKLLANSNQLPAAYVTRAWASCFSVWKGAWRPTGITKDAFNRLKENNFSSLQGIHRAHIIPRYDVFVKARGKTWSSIDEWWDFMVEHDQCVLATKEENALSDKSDYKLVPKYKIPNDERNLFETTFIGCKFRKSVEVKFLKEEI